MLRSALNIRVADVHAVYRDWSSKGATFLTPPKDHGEEIRCYLRDPDGHLIEVGQTTGGLAASVTLGFASGWDRVDISFTQLHGSSPTAARTCRVSFSFQQMRSVSISRQAPCSRNLTTPW